MEFRILGTLEATVGGRSVVLPRAKQRALLAMLVLHPNQVVSTDRLVDALWEGHPPASAANTLQGYVSHLRRALTLTLVDGDPEETPQIRTQPPGYMLEVAVEDIDACRFQRLVAEARRAISVPDARGAVDLFSEALSLWRGPALADFTYDEFAAVEARRLEELRLAAIEDCADAELALGDHAALVGRLQALVDDHPLRERLCGQLMLALYRCGRQADALRAFQSARRTLTDELGIDPSPALGRLEADILAQAPSLERARPRTTAADGDSRVADFPFPALLSVGPSVDYVGREALLGCLAEAARQAAAGACRAVLLAGEPGVGKTRTATEVAQAAFAEGAVVLYGRCDDEMSVPYQPFAEALDWYTAHAAEPILGRHPGELTRLQPLLPTRVAGLAAPVSSDPRSEEYLLFDATTSWLLALACRRPLVLVIDDLHWASKPVLLLLRHLLRAAAAEGQGSRLLLLGTYRDTELGRSHPLCGVMGDLRQLPVVEELAVVGLSLAEVEAFVSRSVGQELDDDTRQLAAMVHAETEGNPFFVDEVLQHLMEAGTVDRSGARRVIIARVRVTVPDGVRDVVSRRLGRLSPQAEKLLLFSAVLGRDFDVELLAALSDLPEGRLLDALDEALAARLIDETGPDHYRFAHALVRATLLEQLSATRRRRLHRRAAEVSEKLRPDDVITLAHHFTEAGPDRGEMTQAVRYSLAAAEQALAARALADAEGRFRRVLELVEVPGRSDASERIMALCGLGEAQRDQGDPGFRATLLEAGRLAQEAGDVCLLVRAALSNSRLLPSIIGGVDAERVALTQTALDLIGPEPSSERARLLAQLASEITFTRDDARRLALADEAEEMARRVGDPAQLAEVLNRTGYAAFSPSRVDRLVARGEEATRLSDASGDPAQRVLSRFFWSAALLTAGDLPRFKEVTEEMLAVSADAAPTLQWLARVTQARVRMIDGQTGDVKRMNDDAFQMAQELSEPDGPAWWSAVLSCHQWQLDGFAELADLLAVGVTEYPDEPAWRIGHAMSLAMGGRHAEAREVLSSDPPDPEVLVHHVFPFLNTVLAAVIAFHLDDADLAARTATALRPYGSFWMHHYGGTLGRVSFGLALCAAVVGDLDEAVALCEETDRVMAGFGCAGLLPQFRAYYAEILWRRGSADDRSLAHDLLERVRRDATDLQAPQLVARAGALTELVDRSTGLP